MMSNLCNWRPSPPRRRRQSYLCENRRNGVPTCRPPGADTTIPNMELPEDIWQHIHSLMPMRDAARAACVSRRFLRFWRVYPNVTIDHEILASRSYGFWIRRFRSEDERGEYILKKAQQVLERRSGSTVVTSLRLDLSTCRKAIVSATGAGGLLDSLLRAFVKPGIKDITMFLPKCDDDHDHDLPVPVPAEYTFPCTLFSDDNDEKLITSLQSLSLSSCGFHPTEGGIGCWKSLSTVCLRRVAITDEELGFFLAGCLALERLDLSCCDTIGALKIPRALRRLRSLRVRACRLLRTIESGAPMLAAVFYDGWPLLGFSLGGALETTGLEVHATRMGDVIQYAAAKLPSAAPDLETLVLSTVYERLKEPVMPDKFQKLKNLVICLGQSTVLCAGYDFFSLACFLDACPALETFVLRIADGIRWYNNTNLGKPDEEATCKRQEASELPHGGLAGNLKKVTITGFCSANSLVELICHIVVVAASTLERLTLDTSPGYDRKCSSHDRCWKMSAKALREAETSLAAARKYVEPIVPDGVDLKVLGPCSRCHLGMEQGS